MSIVADARLSADWRQLGACTALTPSEHDRIFFPAESNEVVFAEAKALCAGCPVRLICLGNALDTDETTPFGVFGGLGPRERRVMRASDPQEGNWERRLTAQFYAGLALDGFGAGPAATAATAPADAAGVSA